MYPLDLSSDWKLRFFILRFTGWVSFINALAPINGILERSSLILSISLLLSGFFASDGRIYASTESKAVFFGTICAFFQYRPPLLTTFMITFLLTAFTSSLSIVFLN